MFDGRIYRAAFVPLLFVLVIAGFSLASRPGPLRSTLAPDAFDGARAAASRWARIAIGLSPVEPGRSAITVVSVRAPSIVCAWSRRSVTWKPPPAVPEVDGVPGVDGEPEVGEVPEVGGTPNPRNVLAM